MKERARLYHANHKENVNGYKRLHREKTKKKARHCYEKNKKKNLKYQRLYSEKQNGKKIKQVKRRYYGKNK